MKTEIIAKLKAFILDSSASEWEQNNAIKILEAYIKRGYNVGEIPKPVRPKPQEKPKEELATAIQEIVKVFISMKTFYVDVFVSKKIPFQRLKKNSFQIPILISEVWSMPWFITIEKETVYKTIFQHYKEEYIRFDKVAIDTFIIMEEWKPFQVWTELIKESEEFIGKKEYWSPEAFNEYSKECHAYKITL